MNQLKFWIYISKELSDLVEDFSTIFDAHDFYRDYENVWEWVEGKSNWLDSNINISRTHNWEQGEYDCPLIIRIDYAGNDQEDVIDQVGRKIINHLRTETYFGEINFIKGNEFRCIEKKRFSIDTK